MATAADSPPPPRPWRRWFAFLGGGIAWTAHLLAIYAIAEFGCVSGLDQIHFLGISAVAWMLLIVSLVLIVIAAAAAVVGYRDACRALPWADHPEVDGPEPVEGGDYLSQFGWILSALFVLVILVESLPMFFYLDGC